MDTIFDAAFNDEKKMTPSDFQGWADSIRASHRTGVLRAYTSPENKTIYYLARDAWHIHGSDMPVDSLSADGEVTAGFLPLTPIEMSHLALLWGACQRQKEEAITPERASLNNGGTYLLKVQLDTEVGSILYNGFAGLPYSLLVSPKKIIGEAGISENLLQMQSDPSCTAGLYLPDLSMDEWREIFLRKAFKQFYDCMLERCETQTGRSIVEAFGRLVSAFAAEHKLDISIEKRQWRNEEFFSTSKEAASYYNLALSELLDHFSAVIGPRLLAWNLREVFADLPEESRELLKNSKILPEGYLS